MFTEKDLHERFGFGDTPPTSRHVAVGRLVLKHGLVERGLDNEKFVEQRLAIAGVIPEVNESAPVQEAEAYTDLALRQPHQMPETSETPIN